LYKHFPRLDDTDYGVNETWQISLSNASDINRGTVGFDMARSIINRFPDGAQVEVCCR